MSLLSRAAVVSFVKAHCELLEAIPPAYQPFETQLRGAFKVKHARSSLEVFQDGIEHDHGGFIASIIDLGHQERVVLYHMDMSGCYFITEVPWDSIRALQLRYASMPGSTSSGL